MCHTDKSLNKFTFYSFYFLSMIRLFTEDEEYYLQHYDSGSNFKKNIFVNPDWLKFYLSV